MAGTVQDPKYSIIVGSEIKSSIMEAKLRQVPGKTKH